MTALAPPANPESVFTYGAPQLKFRPGAADEIGYDLSRTGARRVLVVTDPCVAATGSPQRTVTDDDVADVYRRSIDLW
jgi:hydroxyacid-oxoacid transhydrogenase